MERTIKIVLSLLLFICLADMPYSYYQFVRFAGLIGFSILAYKAYEHNKQIEIIIVIGLALMFQPFFKISRGRKILNIVDMVVGIGLILSIWINSKKLIAKASIFFKQK